MKKVGQLGSIKRFFVLAALLFTFGINYAQEGGAPGNCGDGIDNDGDGYIDCYDGECAGSAACDLAIVGKPVPDCSAVPSPSPVFSIKEKWRTNEAMYEMDNRQTPIVGDIDNDGIPEVIGKDKDVDNALYIFNGLDGSLERQINSPKTDLFLDAVAIGDVDGDGFGEIFIVARRDGNAANENRRLFCYEHDGTEKWKSAEQIGYGNDADRWTPHLADFNEDGVPEVYLGNQIFNAATGARLVNGGSSGSKGASPASSDEPFPVAVDILADAACADCAGLELVAGNTVYVVDIAGGTLTEEVKITGFDDGLTSIVDLDRDGDLDVVVTSREDIDPTAGTDNRGIVYAWDGQTNTQIGTTFQIDNATESPGSTETSAGGQCNIADFNGDGTLEIGLAGEHVYVVIDYDEGTDTFTELWSYETFDGSERTGSSVFDFEGDGSNEVVYKDENSLFIFRGSDGTVMEQIACGSGTRYDFPLVADVDADGQTDIICACADGPGNGSNNSSNGYIIAFEATTDPWVKARRVLNQHSYFVVNVNDDLTIPRTLQKHNVGFPQANPTRYPLNAFLTQMTELTVDGTPSYKVPDPAITISDPSTDVTFSGTCGSGTIELDILVQNLGEEVLSRKMPFSLYRHDPADAGSGSQLIQTFTLGQNIQPGDEATITASISDQGGINFDLYIITNHAESGGAGNAPATYPLTEADYESSILECRPSNNKFSIPIKSVCAVGISAKADEFTMNEDDGLTGNVIVDNGNGVDSDPQGGTISVTTTPIDAPVYGSLSLLANGNFTYTPNAHFFGLDQFTYELCDNGGDCATTTVTITVNSVNDVPVANDDSPNLNEDDSFSGNVLTNDSYPDGELPQYVSGPASGTLSWTGDGTYTYTPNPDFNGADSFTYQICDDGSPACDPATVTLNVANTNDPPSSADNIVSTNEDVDKPFTLTDFPFTDIDPGASLDHIEVSNFSGPGTLFLDDDADDIVDPGEEITSTSPARDISAGDIPKLTFRPAANASGTGYATFDFRVNDGTDDSALPANILTINVNAVNDAPVVDLDAATSGTDYATSFTEGDTDVAIAKGDATIADVDDTQLSSLTVTLTNRPDGMDEDLSVSSTLPTGISITDPYDNADGQLVLSGVASVADYQTALRQLVYNNSSENPNTTDRNITVVANDGDDNSATTTTTLDVDAVNDAPVSNNADPVVINADEEDTDVALGLSAPSDIDNDDNTLVITDYIACVRHIDLGRWYGDHVESNADDCRAYWFAVQCSGRLQRHR